MKNKPQPAPQEDRRRSAWREVVAYVYAEIDALPDSRQEPAATAGVDLLSERRPASRSPRP